ncbi:metalloregulator ArsR/SmtB family transcription factor [Paraburkholderia acidisoli]|uniref:Metalloregulator ArsR/SmtB family transcription factor n=2 Tax=Paraburkholderia acidisoli TaxID=2571748 RepID=A0A7Z2GK65_9BURK|nr:metalloregulator ArsR/SmtB family transcription factor [Paraburkholderia acidisoli]
MVKHDEAASAENTAERAVNGTAASAIERSNETAGEILTRTFAALADPTRRAMLARLARHDELSVSTLAEPFDISLPAVMKHLDVLAQAGLVTRAKSGRTVACRLAAGPLEDAMQWLAHYQRFWGEQLDRLAAFVEGDACLTKPTPTLKSGAKAAANTPRITSPIKRPVSRSADACGRAPRKSGPRGRSPSS